MKNLSGESNKNYYHNTRILLQKYRKIMVGMEMAAEDLQYIFLEETGFELLHLEKLADFLDLDLNSQQLKSRLISMEKNKKMIAILNHALLLMRDYEDKGETFYFILYYKYFCKNDEKPVSISHLSQLLTHHDLYLGDTTIKNYTHQAIESFSDILWGYTSLETEGLLKEFLH